MLSLGSGGGPATPRGRKSTSRLGPALGLTSRENSRLSRRGWTTASRVLHLTLLSTGTSSSLTPRAAPTYTKLPMRTVQPLQEPPKTNIGGIQLGPCLEDVLSRSLWRRSGVGVRKPWTSCEVLLTPSRSRILKLLAWGNWGKVSLLNAWHSRLSVALQKGNAKCLLQAGRVRGFADIVGDSDWEDDVEDLQREAAATAGFGGSPA